MDTLLTSAIPTAFFSIIGFWRASTVFFLLAAGSSFILGMRWYDSDGSAFGLAMSLIFWVYSVVCLMMGLICLFKKEDEG